MSLRAAELKEVAGELDARLRGAGVQKVFAPLPKLAYLELRVPGQSVWLCLSAEAELGRASVIDRRPPAPPEPPAFQRRLREELTGARLESVTASGRALELAFTREGHGRRLYLELAGPHGNLYLLSGEDPEARVLALAASPSGARQGLRVGATFSAHPAGEGSGGPSASRLAANVGADFPFARAAEALFAQVEEKQRAEAVRRQQLAPLKRQADRLRRTVEKVRAEASRAPDAEAHREAGELLTQNLHQVQRGQTSVRLTAYTEQGPVERVLALDPALAPKEQAERHFHQYRRLLRGCEHARRRLVELEAEAAAVQARISALHDRPDAELAGEALAAPPPSRPAGPPQARPYKEYASSSGARILVGKGAPGNDALTFKVARPQDLWLHALGLPGAHVVVPLDKGATLPQELLLDAAHLALHHSGAKGEPRGEVSYTHAKFVRKVKGGAPGQVVYTREKTFVVRLEPERLQRLLKSGAEG